MSKILETGTGEQMSEQAKLDAWNTHAMEVILHKTAKIDVVVDAIKEMKATMEKLADAVTKLAVIEERQNTDRLALERAFAEIAKLQKRQDEDSDRHTTKVETALVAMTKSVERVHTRLDEHGKELQNDLDSIKDRLSNVEATLPETNRLKEWGYEAIKFLAIAGVVSYIAKVKLSL